VNYWLVTKDYFSATGIPLLAGRTFDSRDTLAVAIINEAFARRYFQNEDPIGKVIRIPDWKKREPGKPREIVGVVGSVRQRGLREEAVPILYVHYTDFATGSIALTVRTQENPAVVLPALRAAIQQVNPELVMTRVSTAEELVAQSFSGQRFATLLMFVFAALGTLLAAVGLYGVLTYAVSQRVQEIGIRMALGAQRADVLGMVLRQGMTLVAVGMVTGLIAALAFGRLMGSLLFNVSPTDPATFVTIAILLCAVALLACWLPARRAATVDPMEALRYE
jgi:putative ABC transport system permease protein